MAFIHEPGSCTWEREYTNQVQAAQKAIELEKKYNTLFTVNQPEWGTFTISTTTEITGEEHAIACKCDACLE